MIPPASPLVHASSYYHQYNEDLIWKTTANIKIRLHCVTNNLGMNEQESNPCCSSTRTWTFPQHGSVPHYFQLFFVNSLVFLVQLPSITWESSGLDPGSRVLCWQTIHKYSRKHHKHNSIKICPNLESFRLQKGMSLFGRSWTCAAIVDLTKQVTKN